MHIPQSSNWQSQNKGHSDLQKVEENALVDKFLIIRGVRISFSKPLAIEVSFPTLLPLT